MVRLRFDQKEKSLGGKSVITQKSRADSAITTLHKNVNYLVYLFICRTRVAKGNNEEFWKFPSSSTF